MSDLILLIDDDDNLRRVTEYNLTTDKFQVISGASGREGLKLFRKNDPDLIVTDIKLGDMNGLEILNKVKKDRPDIPVIIITAFGTIEMAVKAMREGAFHFITKPFDRDTLRLSCRKALELKKLRSQNQHLSNEINRLTGTKGMVTANSAMKELLDNAFRVADSEATVLIIGESGTGKEVLARLIHQHSQRKSGPMVAVNCAAIPSGLIESELFGHVKGAFTNAVSDRKGRFQLASTGTLFLDEIGDLKTDMQVKILRAIQEREIDPVGSEKKKKIDIRIIAATNKDLQQAVLNGEFREDLYYRISVVPLHIPPLRDRSEDISALVKHFLKKFNAPPDVLFSKKAIAVMKEYAWPGNIRELQNAVERCIIMRKGTIIEKTDLNLNPSFVSTGPLITEIPEEGVSLFEIEKNLIKTALDKSSGNRSNAARLLNIPRHVLIYRIKKYKL